MTEETACKPVDTGSKPVMLCKAEKVFMIYFEPSEFDRTITGLNIHGIIFQRYIEPIGLETARFEAYGFDFHGKLFS